MPGVDFDQPLGTFHRTYALKQRFGELCLVISPEIKHLFNVPEKPLSGGIIDGMDIGQENPIAPAPRVTCKGLPLKLEIRAGCSHIGAVLRLSRCWIPRSELFSDRPVWGTQVRRQSVCRRAFGPERHRVVSGVQRTGRRSDRRVPRDAEEGYRQARPVEGR